MWEDDSAAEYDSSPFDPGPFDSPRDESPEERPAEPPPMVPGGMFPPSPLQGQMLPNVVPTMNLYEAARARAVADQQLSKLFNPEYYI
jgi:hypothetical protein